MKRLIFLFAVIFAFSAVAENQDEGKFEAEIGLSLTGSIDGYHQYRNSPFVSPIPNLEVRYNLPRNFDVGLRFGATYVDQSFHLIADKTHEYKLQRLNRSIYLVGVADYNFRQGKKFNPFVGLGLGVGFNRLDRTYIEPDKNDIIDYGYKTRADIYFMPRCGIELWRHLRVGAAVGITRKGHNSWNFSLGWTFGFKPRKTNISQM